MNIQHDSDCAVHNMPAFPNGPCDCGVDEMRERITNYCKSMGRRDDNTEVIEADGILCDLLKIIDDA